MSCCCRFRNNDIQWTSKHFFPPFFSWVLMQPGNVQLYCHSSEMSTWLWRLFPLLATLIRLLNKPSITCMDGVSLEDIILYIWLLSAFLHITLQEISRNELIRPSDCSWAPQITSLIKSWAIYSLPEERLSSSCCCFVPITLRGIKTSSERLFFVLN